MALISDEIQRYEIIITFHCLIIFEPALLKSAGKKSSHTSSDFQHVDDFHHVVETDKTTPQH